MVAGAPRGAGVGRVPARKPGRRGTPAGRGSSHFERSRGFQGGQVLGVGPGPLILTIARRSTLPESHSREAHHAVVVDIPLLVLQQLPARLRSRFRSEEHTAELQSLWHLALRLL